MGTGSLSLLLVYTSSRPPMPMLQLLHVCTYMYICTHMLCKQYMFRNPEPRSRPQFGKISKLLDNTNSGYLLCCSDEDKQNNKEGTLKLGLSLEVSDGLFYDLQTMYSAK